MTNCTTIRDYSQTTEKVKNDLEEHGWWKGNCKVADLTAFMQDLANKLGDPIGIRSEKKLVEVLQPIQSELAYPNSLSRQFSLSELPFHCDTAHWPNPCRFVVLGCKEQGTCGRTTNLVDWKILTQDLSEVRLLKHATFLIKHGRSSFYSSIIHEKGLYARFDPGCMFPASIEAVRALRLFHSLLNRAEKHNVLWETNDVVVIDNWRMLHARGKSNHPFALTSTRELHRIVVI